MADLKTRLMTVLAEISAKSAMAEVIRYTIGHWDGLTAFIVDGRIEVDTNTVERTMRSIGLGRKNSLYAGSADGGQSWAILSSLVNTAKLNGLDPFTYLADVLETDGQWPGHGQSAGRAAAMGLESSACGRRPSQGGMTGKPDPQDGRTEKGGRRSHHQAYGPRGRSRPISWPAARARRCLTIVGLDGYLTALIIGPKFIDPRLWLTALVGDTAIMAEDRHR